MVENPEAVHERFITEEPLFVALRFVGARGAIPTAVDVLKEVVVVE